MTRPPPPRRGGRAPPALERHCHQRGRTGRCTAAWCRKIASPPPCGVDQPGGRQSPGRRRADLRGYRRRRRHVRAGADRRGACRRQLCQRAGLQRGQAAGAGAPPARAYRGQLSDPPRNCSRRFCALSPAAGTATSLWSKTGAVTACWAARWTTPRAKRSTRSPARWGVALPRRAQRLAGRPRAATRTPYKLPVPHVEGKYNVSFSGLKTAVVNEVHNAEQRGEACARPPIWPPASRSASRRSWPKSCWPPRPIPGAKTVCLAGGVAAQRPPAPACQRRRAEAGGARVFLPELKYCGDNAAMIAAQGYHEYKDGNLADLRLKRPADA